MRENLRTVAWDSETRKCPEVLVSNCCKIGATALCSPSTAGIWLEPVSWWWCSATMNLYFLFNFFIHLTTFALWQFLPPKAPSVLSVLGVRGQPRARDSLGAGPVLVRTRPQMVRASLQWVVSSRGSFEPVTWTTSNTLSSWRTRTQTGVTVKQFPNLSKSQL